MKLGPRPNGRPWTCADDAQLLALLRWGQATLVTALDAVHRR